MNRNSLELSSWWALDYMLARSEVQWPNSHNVAVHVVRSDLEAPVAVVGCDAHTVADYRDDAGPQDDWNIAADMA